jgi:hypothetical protein
MRTEDDHGFRKTAGQSVLSFPEKGYPKLITEDHLPEKHLKINKASDLQLSEIPENYSGPESEPGKFRVPAAVRSTAGYPESIGIRNRLTGRQTPD